MYKCFIFLQRCFEKVNKRIRDQENFIGEVYFQQKYSFSSMETQQNQN